ncbi:glycosyltransferase [Neobacillus ginsengisoli]|uniref:glycosyltransferase n=1 Tax=Neobacillus ginsengisoli TaxID=904295 RepID=UPI0035204320
MYFFQQNKNSPIRKSTEENEEFHGLIFLLLHTVGQLCNNFFPPYLESAKHIITISKRTTKDLVEWTGINKKKISIIYQGIDPHFKRIPKETAKELMKKHFDVNHPYIFTMGRQVYHSILS